jgi:hypothetical protein
MHQPTTNAREIVSKQKLKEHSSPIDMNPRMLVVAQNRFLVCNAS